MNRRSFFRSLAATALVSLASQTRLAPRLIEIVADPVTVGERYAAALAASLIETKETLAANIINRAFNLNEILPPVDADARGYCRLLHAAPNPTPG